MKRRTQGGFTLIELVVAMVLLGTMMSLLYSGLQFALRSWDAGDANGSRVADRQLAENFLRREVKEVFPMRWKDPSAVRFAFEGTAQRLRFVSSRPAGVGQGGLSLVGISVEASGKGRTHDLVMRRAQADVDSADFSTLDAAEPTVLIPGVEDVAFAYFGSENDFTDPKWVDDWKYAWRMPTLIRARIRMADGSVLPDLVMSVMIGEEAGCFENALQRQCRPRTT